MMTTERDLLPDKPPLFDATAEFIRVQSNAIIEQTRQLHQNICNAVTPTTATFSNTVTPLINNDNQRRREANLLEFYQQVATKADVRAASRDAEQAFKEQDIDSYNRSDLFQLVTAVYHQQEDILPESRRWLEKEHRSFLSNGLQLGIEDRARLQDLRKQINHHAVEFNKCLNEEAGGVGFFYDELDGVPEATRKTFWLTDGGKFKVTFQGPDLVAVLTNAKSSAVRQKLYIANANKCKSNVALLKDVLVMRDEAARLLGYANHAEFRLQDKLEKSPERVSQFLSEVRHKLADRGHQELDRLLNLKRKDYMSKGQQFDGRYYLWDHAYYSRLLLEQECHINQEEVAEFFPLGTTLKGMLEIFEELFGMTFYKVDHTKHPDCLVWHRNVEMFSVWDGLDSPDSVSHEFLGYFYLDLHPRRGKFGHAGCFTIRPGFHNADGSRSFPATALVCNFTNPTKDKPSLLKHSEVWMLFHELGHGIHDLLSKTQHARFHGTQTVQDFCEAPSQMLENWCWTYSTLQRLSHHYSRLSPDYLAAWQAERSTSDDISVTAAPEKIPKDMLDSLIQTKHVNQALFYRQSLYVSTFDMAVHSFASHDQALQVNPSSLWNRLQTEIIGISGPDALGEGFEWGHGEANFYHLLGDYDAGYYGYLSAQVYSFDMFHTYFKTNPMNTIEGRRYRYMVLEKGGSIDELDMLRAYLGRDPSVDAFYEHLGITTKPAH